MKTRVKIIFTLVVCALLLMQFYIAQSVWQWLLTFDLNQVQRQAILCSFAGLLIYFNLTIPVRILLRNKDFPLLKYLIFPGAAWLITMMMMFVFFLAEDVLASILSLFQTGDHDGFLQAAGAASVGAPLVLTAYGALTARDYRVERVDLRFPSLPAGLDGFTIAQISDIHSGIYMNEREMWNILEILNSLHPQIVALTGDFVDTRAEEIGPVAKVFSEIRSDYGVFGCMGNHDLFDDYTKVSQAMRQKGILMLENGNRVLKINGEQLNLLGVADSGRFYDLARIDKALEGIDPEGFKILLAHRPSFFTQAQKSGIDLQISGHTHGGQIVLNFLGVPLNPIFLLEKYVRGLYQEGNSYLYVNPGVGMVLAPIRIGVPPEITLITLVGG